MRERESGGVVEREGGKEREKVRGGGRESESERERGSEYGGSLNSQARCAKTTEQYAEFSEETMLLPKEISKEHITNLIRVSKPRENHDSWWACH